MDISTRYTHSKYCQQINDRPMKKMPHGWSMKQPAAIYITSQKPPQRGILNSLQSISNKPPRILRRLPGRISTRNWMLTFWIVFGEMAGLAVAVSWSYLIQIAITVPQ